MNYNGLFIILLLSLTSCATTPSPSTTPPKTTEAPLEIEETNISKPTNVEGSPITKDIDVAQPSPISEKTVDCVLTLLIDKECGGFSVDDSSE